MALELVAEIHLCSRLGLGFHPGDIKETQEDKGQKDQEKDNAAQEHDNREAAAQIGMKGDVAETQGGHDGEGPVKTGQPGVIMSLIGHNQVKKNAVNGEKQRQEDQVTQDEPDVLLGVQVSEEEEELMGYKLHGEEG